MTKSEYALLVAVAEHLVELPHQYHEDTHHALCVMLKRVAPIKSATPPAEPKPSASTLPQRLRANSYNAPTWTDCDAMREAAHALENKDAEIAAVIRDNDAKIDEIERLKTECADWKRRAERQFDASQTLAGELGKLRNPDIKAAAKRLENIAVPITSFHRHFGASSHIGELTDVGRIAVARAILTREPG